VIPIVTATKDDKKIRNANSCLDNAVETFPGFQVQNIDSPVRTKTYRKPLSNSTPLTKLIEQAGVPSTCRDILKQQCVSHDQLKNSKVDEKLLSNIGIPLGHALLIVETAQRGKSKNTDDLSHQRSSKPKAAQKNSARQNHEELAEEWLEKIYQKEQENFAPNTGRGALNAINFCEANVDGISNFNDTEPNTILLSLMDHNDNEEEAEEIEPATFLSRMRNTLSALSKQKSGRQDCNSRYDEVSPRVMEAFMRKTRQYEKASKRKRKTGQQIAFKPLTPKDTLHIINSIIRKYGASGKFVDRSPSDMFASINDFCTYCVSHG
jgi:hypothetical protein